MRLIVRRARIVGWVVVLGIVGFGFGAVLGFVVVVGGERGSGLSKR